MARPSKATSVRAATAGYFAEAIKCLPSEKPLTEVGISVNLGISRVTLRKHVDTAALKAAREEQRVFANSAAAKARRSFDERIAARDAEITRLLKQNEGLLARLCLVEGNAQLLGIDPAMLYAPLEAPPRDQPEYGK